MIGINIDTKINLTNDKRKHYPLVFNTNTCTACGKEGTLKIIDKFVNISNKEIHPFDHIKCIACGAIYTIKWEQDDKDHMHPQAVDPGLKDRFFNGLGNIVQNVKSEINNLL